MDEKKQKRLILGLIIILVFFLLMCIGSTIFISIFGEKIGKHVGSKLESGLQKGAEEFAGEMAKSMAGASAAAYAELIIERLPNGVNEKRIHGLALRISYDYYDAMDFTGPGSVPQNNFMVEFNEAMEGKVTPEKFNQLVNLANESIYHSKCDEKMISGLKKLYRDAKADNQLTVEEVDQISRAMVTTVKSAKKQGAGEGDSQTTAAEATQ